MNNLLIESIRSKAGKAQFASFCYTTKKTLSKKSGEVLKGGEKSRYVIILGANYGNLLDKSLLAAQLLTKEDIATIVVEHANDYLDELTPEIMEAARQEVIQSFEKSIAAHKAGTQSDDYTKKGQYIPLGNGLNINSNDGTLQVFGLVQSKVVLENGVFKHVNSAIETIAKDAIKKSLPISKFREFALDAGNIHFVKLAGNVLIFGDEPEQVVVIQRQPAPVQKKNEVKDIFGDMSEERHTMDLEL